MTAPQIFFRIFVPQQSSSSSSNRFIEHDVSTPETRAFFGYLCSSLFFFFFFFTVLVLVACIVVDYCTFVGVDSEIFSRVTVSLCTCTCAVTVLKPWWLSNGANTAVRAWTKKFRPILRGGPGGRASLCMCLNGVLFSLNTFVRALNSLLGTLRAFRSPTPLNVPLPQAARRRAGERSVPSIPSFKAVAKGPILRPWPDQFWAKKKKKGFKTKIIQLQSRHFPG